jgi:hypothetical protein
VFKASNRLELNNMYNIKLISIITICSPTESFLFLLEYYTNAFPIDKKIISLNNNNNQKKNHVQNQVKQLK